MAETLFETGLYRGTTLRGTAIWLLRKDALRREIMFLGEAAQSLMRDVREAQTNFENSDAMIRDRAINAACNFYFDEAAKQQQNTK